MERTHYFFREERFTVLVLLKGGEMIPIFYLWHKIGAAFVAYFLTRKYGGCHVQTLNQAAALSAGGEPHLRLAGCGGKTNTSLV
jgi:hypothetical protein